MATRARPSSDRLIPLADSIRETEDADLADLFPPGWPCANLPLTPPSVADRQSDPDPDAVYAQIAGVLTPRGPAWGTDEAGDGRGAGPVMRQLWRALATWTARLNADEWTLATQALPSAISYSLPDWETELGLPDPCVAGSPGTAARIAAVRARFGALGGASPAYFVCLAASLGYEITIEEPTQFLIDVSEVGPDSITEDWFRIDEGEIDGTPLESFALTPGDDSLDEVGVDPFDGGVTNAAGIVWKFWIVHVRALGETWFTIDEGRIDTDPLEGFLTAADLECVLRRASPAHTELIFAYDV